MTYYKFCSDDVVKNKDTGEFGVVSYTSEDTVLVLWDDTGLQTGYWIDFVHKHIISASVRECKKRLANQLKGECNV